MNVGGIVGLGTVSLIVGGLCAAVLWPALQQRHRAETLPPSPPYITQWSSRLTDPVTASLMAEWESAHQQDVADHPASTSRADPSTLRMVSRPGRHRRHHPQQYFPHAAPGQDAETRRLNLEQAR
jgi:hypothetical protein